MPEPMPSRLPPTIALRPFQSSDAGFFAGLASDERVTRYIGDGSPWLPAMVDERVDAALKHEAVDRLGAIRWFLAAESGTPVGIVVSTRKEDGVEIGYWVSPEHWGRGVAGAMVNQALATIPCVYGTGKLIARVDPGNAASAKLLTRRGFQYAGSDAGLDHYILK